MPFGTGGISDAGTGPLLHVYNPISGLGEKDVVLRSLVLTYRLFDIA
jgi:hypothetical protein